MSKEPAVRQNSRAGTGPQSGHNRENAQAHCLRFGVFQLDLQQQQLFKDGMQVKVQSKVYQALIALVEAPGEIVTREALRTHLWPRDTHLNYQANVNTTVNKLRQILGDTNEESKYIETIPRKGYSFIARVEYVDGATISSDSNGAGAPERATSNWKFLRPPRFLSSGPARIWFTASVIALVMAAFLFGAAVTLYSHRPVQHEVAARPGQEAQQSNKP